MQTGHTLRTMVSYILHLLFLQKNKGHIYFNCFEVFPRTLCLRVQVDSVLSQAVCFMTRTRSWVYCCEVNTISCQIIPILLSMHMLKSLFNKSLICTSTGLRIFLSEGNLNAY